MTIIRSALALKPLGNVAGIASAIYGTLFFSVGSALGAMISALMADSVLPLVTAYVIIGITGLMLALCE